MKKSLISLGLFTALALSVNAQDATTTAPAAALPSGSEFKPSAGNITVEVLAASPFSGGGATPFSLSGSETGIPSLRFRYFINESLAFRLNFSIDASKSNQDLGSTQDFSNSTTGTGVNTSNSGSTTPTQYKLNSNRFMVAIAPGLEFHKAVSERLSVYYGGYIDFAMQSAKGKITGTPGSSSTSGSNNGTPLSGSQSTTGDYTYEVKGQNLGDLSDLGPATDWSSNGTNLVSPTFNKKNGDALRNDGARAYTRLGIMGVLGADYYITKGLYLGLEVSWGYANTAYKKVTAEEKYTLINTTTTTNGTPTPAVPAPVTTGSSKVTENKDNNWNIAPAVNAAFRFGFWF